MQESSNLSFQDLIVLLPNYCPCDLLYELSLFQGLFGGPNNISMGARGYTHMKIKCLYKARINGCMCSEKDRPMGF